MSDHVEVHARLNKHGVPIYGDTNLLVHDGTEKIVFVAGRAQVPARLIPFVQSNPNLVVLVPAPIVAPAPAAASEGKSQPEGAGAPPVPADPAAGDQPALSAEQQAAIDLAKEHLEDDGDPVPVTIPAGFDAKTEDDRPRCLAPKGDGEQCKNAAVDGTHACALPAHVAAVAGE